MPNKYGTIYEISPSASDKRYGKVLNDHISLFPDDAWIIIRDQDTCYLHPSSIQIIEQAIKDNPTSSLMTCLTNRVCNPDFTMGKRIFEETDMRVHLQIAHSLKGRREYKKIYGHVPGYFWLFPKRTWMDNPFDDKPIVSNGASFDIRWTRNITGDKFIILGLYIFHLYRLWGSRWDTDHVR